MRPAPTLVNDCDVSVYVGVSKRSWRSEIVQDHLEEAEEMFEVLLVSPQGTVIGSNNKARVTIKDSARGKSCIVLRSYETLCKVASFPIIPFYMPTDLKGFDCMQCPVYPYHHSIVLL